MIKYFIYEKQINRVWDSSYTSKQAAIWDLVAHTSKRDRTDSVYQVYHYDNGRVVIDWCSC